MIWSLTRLPRIAKTLILLGVDAIVAACAFWFAAFIRLGRWPEMPPHYVLFGTILVVVLVPLIGLASGLYRSIVHLHMPLLPSRVGVVGLVAGICVAALGIAGGASGPHAIGHH